MFRARFRDSGYANATASPGVIVVIIVIVSLAGIIMLTRYSIYVVDREVSLSLSLSLRWREPCEPACARASELKGLATRGGYHVPVMNMYGNGMNVHKREPPRVLAPLRYSRIYNRATAGTLSRWPRGSILSVVATCIHRELSSR